MSLNIDAFHTLTTDAIQHFWSSRQNATKNQSMRGISDQGNRSGVTAGKNLDGFTKLIKRIIIDNGIDDVYIYDEGRVKLTLPGYFRPTKNWDLLVVKNQQLIAVIELKSQVGPSFGNNFNNRVEEAIGNSTDLKTAFREGAFGESYKPFIGYLFVLEECKRSLSPVRFSSQHFSTFPEFTNASYANRYDIFCKKLIQEELYDAASLILTKSENRDDGGYRCLSELTGFKRFITTLAAKAAAISMD